MYLYVSIQYFPRGKWSNPIFRELYANEVRISLDSWEPVDIDNVNQNTAMDVINELCNSLCNVLHVCVERCLQTTLQKRTYCGKQWWNSDCFIAKKGIVSFTIYGKKLDDPKLALFTIVIKQPKGTIEMCVDLQ
jgi:hypothetical protein